MKHKLTEEEVQWVESQAHRSLQRARAKVHQALDTTRTPHERLLVCQHALQWASRVLDAAAFLQTAVQNEAEVCGQLPGARDNGATAATAATPELGEEVVPVSAATRRGLA